MNDLEYQVAKLSLGPDDVLVVRYNGVMSAAVGQRLADMVKGTMPEGSKTMIIDHSVDLSVVSGPVERPHQERG